MPADDKAPLRLGLIGYGAIGAPLAAAFAPGNDDGVAVVGVLVRRPRPAAEDGPPLVTSLDALQAAAPRLVVECAGHEAVRCHVGPLLAAGTDVVLTSIGALTDDALRDRLAAQAEAGGGRLRIAAAGIGSLDMLAAAAVGGLASVTITVRKDPSAWHGTPAEKRLALDAVAMPTILFDGPVRDGAALYPQNVNIAAATALAGIGLDRTRLVIVVDPTITDHVVEIEAEGEFGRFSFRESVRPSPENPKTGRIVAMALIKTVRQHAAPVVVGG